MKLNTILLLVFLVVGSAYIQVIKPVAIGHQDGSTPHFAVSLKYNKDYERYEVYATANFTRSRFLLGPSQISIAVPKEVANQSLDIYSATARWTDYSAVYAPAVAANVDFHGVHTMGNLIDFQENVPFMLFSFSVKGGYLDGVRLYVNGQDPASTQPSMMGGDFANTVQDHQSHEFFKGAFSPQELAQLTQTEPVENSPTVSVFPNPVTGDTFTVTAKNFDAGEPLKLRLLSATGVELYGVNETAANVVNYRIKLPKQLSGQAYLYAEPANGQRAFCKKIVIVN